MIQRALCFDPRSNHSFSNFRTSKGQNHCARFTATAGWNGDRREVARLAACSAALQNGGASCEGSGFGLGSAGGHSSLRKGVCHALSLHHHVLEPHPQQRCQAPGKLHRQPGLARGRRREFSHECVCVCVCVVDLECVCVSCVDLSSSTAAAAALPSPHHSPSTPCLMPAGASGHTLDCTGPLPINLHQLPSHQWNGHSNGLLKHPQQHRQKPDVRHRCALWMARHTHYICMHKLICMQNGKTHSHTPEQTWRVKDGCFGLTTLRGCWQTRSVCSPCISAATTQMNIWCPSVLNSLCMHARCVLKQDSQLYTVSWTACCRISTLQNGNHDQPVSFTSTIDLRDQTRAGGWLGRQVARQMMGAGLSDCGCCMSMSADRCCVKVGTVAQVAAGPEYCAPRMLVPHHHPLAHPHVMSGFYSNSPQTALLTWLVPSPPPAVCRQSRDRCLTAHSSSYKSNVALCEF